MREHSFIRDLIKTEAFGLYHMTCQGACSWYQFARLIFDSLNLKTPLEPCKVSDFPMPVKRPTYSVLDNARLNDIQLDQMPGWQDALRDFFKSENH